jgi:hypothetical protein
VLFFFLLFLSFWDRVWEVAQATLKLDIWWFSCLSLPQCWDCRCASSCQFCVFNVAEDLQFIEFHATITQVSSVCQALGKGDNKEPFSTGRAAQEVERCPASTIAWVQAPVPTLPPKKSHSMKELFSAWSELCDN